jgi:hypothetical protein
LIRSKISVGRFGGFGTAAPDFSVIDLAEPIDLVKAWKRRRSILHQSAAVLRLHQPRPTGIDRILHTCTSIGKY